MWKTPRGVLGSKTDGGVPLAAENWTPKDRRKNRKGGQNGGTSISPNIEGVPSPGKDPSGWIQIGESRIRGVARIPLGLKPGEGTPSMLGDMDVPPFWPHFLTFWGLNSIFMGYFFSSTNTKTIFWGIKTTNSHRIRSFWPQILFFPRPFRVQFSAASGTPPSVFGPSTPPPTHPGG